jgi:hypothetical protein
MIGPGCERLARALAWCLERRLTVQQMVEMPPGQPAVAAAVRQTFSELSARIVPAQAKRSVWDRLTWAGMGGHGGGAARHRPASALGARG